MQFTAGAKDVFQSLSGFPMSCNGRCWRPPIRDADVSIPIGFSNELQHVVRGFESAVDIGFNPYRVFQ